MSLQLLPADGPSQSGLCQYERELVREVFGYKGPEDPPQLWTAMSKHDPSFCPEEIHGIVANRQWHDEMRRLLPVIRRVDEVRPGLLLGGGYAARRKDMLAKLGVTHVLNCAGPHVPSFFPGRFSYMTLDIDDSPRQPIHAELAASRVFIRLVLEQGDVVFVHCQKGKSRSVAMVAGYLMAAESLSSGDALAQIRRCRPIAEPNAGFVRQLDGDGPVEPDEIDSSVMAWG
jgi:hypothetical protein